MPTLKAPLVLLSLATASVPATFAQSTHGAVPGSVPFVQGQASIDGKPLSTNNATNPARQMHAGETLATANGSADILLAPGALLRIGKDTTVRLVAADANRTEVRLEQGLANVSVNTVRHDDLLLLDTQNGQTQVLSRGLYTFNAATNTVRVFNGEADVFPGADTTSNVKPVALKEGHELTLGGERAKPASFDRDSADADLLPWTGPKEAQAALGNSTAQRPYNNAGYYPGAYGFGAGYGYGYGYPYLAYGYPYGFGYPYGPYGLWGYPFFGVGFGFYGGYYGGYGVPILRGPLRGGLVGGYGGGHVGLAAGGAVHAGIGGRR